LNKYEGLFILEPSAREEVLKQSLDRIQELIKQAGGKVDKLQKLDQRPFARNSGKRTSGYYVNYLFDAPANATAELDAKLHLESGIIRWQFTRFEPLEEQPPRRRRPETTGGSSSSSSSSSRG
jgi:small subunit ribosomal protein S6